MVIRLIASLSIVSSACGQFIDTGAAWLDPIPCSYTTPNANNKMLEGFGIKGVGYENWGIPAGGTTNKWTVFGDSTKLFPAYNIEALTTNKPTGSCDQAFRFINGTDGVEAVASFDFGLTNDLTSATHSNLITFNLMVESLPAAGNEYYWFSINPGYSPSLPHEGLRMVRLSASTFRIQWAASGSLTLNMSTWYAVRIYFDTAGSANGSSFNVWTKDPVPPTGAPTGGTYVGGGSFTRPVTGIRYILIGPMFDLETADNYTVLIDSMAFYRF